MNTVSDLVSQSPSFRLIDLADRARYQDLRSQEIEALRVEREFLLNCAKRSPETLTDFPEELHELLPGKTNKELTGAMCMQRDDFEHLHNLGNTRFAISQKLWGFLDDVDSRYLGIPRLKPG